MELDGKLIKKEGHSYLKSALNLPEYYGMNLDALYDCLCEMEFEIELINSGEVSHDIIETFSDAASVNKYLKFKIVP